MLQANTNLTLSLSSACISDLTMMMSNPWTDEQTQAKSRTQKEDDHTNFFDQLPYGVVVDILSRLPITSLIQFSFISRSSNSLCHDPHLVSKHLSRESPCLILHSDYPIKNQLHFLQIRDGKARKIDTPFCSWMPEFTILGSSNGLLCLMNSLFPESIYLYNPFTRNYVELAKNLDSVGRIVAYGFGFSPVANDYKVIEVLCHTRGPSKKHDSEVWLYSQRCNSWERRGLVPYALEKWSSPGVVVSGRVHWVGRYDRLIVSCDLADASFGEMKRPGSFSGPSGRWASCHLSSLDGRLCAATPAPPGLGALDIWVMKEYGANESWTKEYSIGVYYPESMISHKMERSSHIWRNMFGKKVVRVLWVLESGEVVLEYRGGGLVCYDPVEESFKELKFVGMPRLYQTTVHVGSLTSASL